MSSKRPLSMRSDEEVNKLYNILSTEKERREILAKQKYISKEVKEKGWVIDFQQVSVTPGIKSLRLTIPCIFYWKNKECPLHLRRIDFDDESAEWMELFSYDHVETVHDEKGLYGNLKWNHVDNIFEGKGCIYVTLYVTTEVKDGPTVFISDEGIFVDIFKRGNDLFTENKEHFASVDTLPAGVLIPAPQLGFP